MTAKTRMSWRSRLQLSTIAITLTMMIGFLALGFVGMAVFLVLAEHFPSSLAALITAGSYLALGLLVTGVAILINKPSHPASSRSAERPADEVEALTQCLDNPALADFIKKHPGTSLVTTLVAGVVVGYSDEARALLKSFSQSQSDKG
ncbi:phage holin family protein [Methylophaga sp.]|jgi:hypothetical protein|uniref:phage holin family protein n=1 Tax=Methylophaga sp. TaxID=2024840 RepID=UPI0014000228|nr:phage holin family protein [Methylophaga sp.]MTI63053.1 phage holin family protein [Methylophaga sp.]